MEVPAHLMVADAYRFVGKPDQALLVMREVSELLKKMQKLIKNVRKKLNFETRQIS